MQGMGLSQPLAGTNLIANNTARSWTDDGDFVPQESELGPPSNANFGTAVVTTNYDPAVMNKQRPGAWLYLGQVDHELASGIGVSVGYFRTWYRNFTVVDNTRITSADYDPFCITSPSHPGLPGGGGNQLCGLYDLKPSAVGRVFNLTTAAANFGKQTEVYNGIDASVNGRFGKSGQFGVGFNTGKTTTDNCFVVDSPQQERFCNVTRPWAGQTQLKMSVSYPIVWQLNVSAVYQNLASPAILANYNVPNAAAAPSLGRNLSACGAAAHLLGGLHRLAAV